LHEIEHVAALAAAEAAEALGLIFDRKDAEAGSVLLVKRAERKRSAAGLLVQRNTHIPEHPTDPHGLPELLSILCEGVVRHHVRAPVEASALRHNATDHSQGRAAPYALLGGVEAYEVGDPAHPSDDACQLGNRSVLLGILNAAGDDV
jgi:hypothetical protein